MHSLYRMPLASLILAGSTVGLIACSSGHVKTSSSASTQARIVKREPAETSPPFASAQETWVYSWTDSQSALSSPHGFLTKIFADAQECIVKLGATTNEVKGCEGSGLAAGPGVYTCDNPFTAHDYGSILVAAKTLKSGNTVGLATGQYTTPPASEGLDRDIVANPRYAGILYNFRANDLNTRALLIRKANIIDEKSVYAVALRPRTYSKFKDHAPFVCTPRTPVADILSNWGDQMEFLSLIFDFFRDLKRENYMHNGALNQNALVAAVASDAVAMSDDEVADVKKKLSAKYNDVNESFINGGCQETESRTPRACLARRIFDSVYGNDGTPISPNNIWKLSTLVSVLRDLNVLAASETRGIKSTHQLTRALATKVSQSPAQLARVNEAFRCVLSYREQIKGKRPMKRFGRAGFKTLG